MKNLATILILVLCLPSMATADWPALPDVWPTLPASWPTLPPTSCPGGVCPAPDVLPTTPELIVPAEVAVPEPAVYVNYDRARAAYEDHGRDRPLIVLFGISDCKACEHLLNDRPLMTKLKAKGYFTTVDGTSVEARKLARFSFFPSIAVWGKGGHRKFTSNNLTSLLSQLRAYADEE